MDRKQTLWEPPRPSASTGRPAQRGRADFVAAAIAVAERDGLGAVTMRRVAAELGTGAASAYRHLGGRDDLVDLMIDQALEPYEPISPTGDPYDDVAAEHIHRLRFVRAHPWLVDALDASSNLSPQRIRLIEIGLAMLADHPAPGGVKIEALSVIAGMMIVQLRHERASRMLDPEVAQAQVQLLQRAAADGHHPHLGAALGQPPATQEDPDERFARLVRRVLEGLLAPVDEPRNTQPSSPE